MAAVFCLYLVAKIEFIGIVKYFGACFIGEFPVRAFRVDVRIHYTLPSPFDLIPLAAILARRPRRIDFKIVDHYTHGYDTSTVRAPQWGRRSS